ncbi:unnamed protein product [Urochloa humidicola]
MDSPIKVVSHLGSCGSGEGGEEAIDAGKSARRPLSLWPGMYHSPVTNALWEARASIFERMMDAGNGAAAAGDDAGEQRAPTELLVKTPAQSRTSIVYKFAPTTSSGSSTGTPGTRCASASCSRTSTPSPARYRSKVEGVILKSVGSTSKGCFSLKQTRRN